MNAAVFAVVPEPLETAAATLGLLAGIVASLGVLAKFTRAGRLVRFVWRRLVADALGSWARDQIEHVVRDVLMKPNGGRSVADVAARLDEQRVELDALRSDVAALAGTRRDPQARTRTTDSQEATL